MKPYDSWSVSQDAGLDFLFEWFVDGVCIRTARVPWNAPAPVCPACLEWRMDVVYVDKDNKCHRCGGKMRYDVRCTCGEIPHLTGCSMGFTTGDLLT